MLETILSKCDKRNSQHGCEQCADCSYDTYCPHDCEKCLDYIHNPSHAPDGHLKENMIVHTWQMFIHANTLVDIHLKSSMLLSDSRPYSI